jgi:iron complex outermembrane recepter protein
LTVSYALVRATFESSFAVQSPHNPGADERGEILVGRGDRVPGVPLHSLKLGAGFSPARRWDVSAELLATSGRYLLGDEANLQSPTAPFPVVNLGTAYRVTRGLLAFVRAENLLDRDHETAGTFGEPGEVFPAFGDPRFLSPGRPFSVEAGVELEF